MKVPHAGKKVRLIYGTTDACECCEPGPLFEDIGYLVPGPHPVTHADGNVDPTEITAYHLLAFKQGWDYPESPDRIHVAVFTGDRIEVIE